MTETETETERGREPERPQGALRVWLRILAFLLAIVAGLFVAQQLGNALHRHAAPTPAASATAAMAISTS